MKRRNFLTSAAVAAGALAAREVVAPATAAAQEAEAAPPHMTWQLWSRHLQWVSTQAQAAADPYGVGVLVGQYALLSGYSAVGLTVRGGGHVLPENAATHLPPMLEGIRSTGCLCDHIGATDISPPLDGADTSWITSQGVNELLAVAAANGITRYRCGNRGFSSNIFGAAMHDQLEGLRANFQRLAEINEHHRLGALYHTQTSIGVTVWEYLRVLQGPMQGRTVVGSSGKGTQWIGSPPIDPMRVGVNFAIGHVGREMPIAGWQTALRYAMPHVRGLALHGPQINRNPTTGRLQNTVVPASQSHIDWTAMFRLLLQGGYNGAAEAQIEHSIVGANGINVSLNNAFFADNAQFVSGNLTPAIMVSEMKKEVDTYKAAAVAAGWTPAQLT
jgi:hypothetical protein